MARPGSDGLGLPFGGENVGTAGSESPFVSSGQALATLFPDAADQTRYASLGGKPNSQQPDLVKSTIAKLPRWSEIVAAFDADGAGRILAEMVRLAVAAVANEAARADLIFTAHLPVLDHFE